MAWQLDADTVLIEVVIDTLLARLLVDLFLLSEELTVKPLVWRLIEFDVGLCVHIHGSLKYIVRVH